MKRRNKLSQNKELPPELGGYFTAAKKLQIKRIQEDVPHLGDKAELLAGRLLNYSEAASEPLPDLGFAFGASSFTAAKLQVKRIQENAPCLGDKAGLVAGRLTNWSEAASEPLPILALNFKLLQTDKLKLGSLEPIVCADDESELLAGSLAKRSVSYEPLPDLGFQFVDANLSVSLLLAFKDNRFYQALHKFACLANIENTSLLIQVKRLAKQAAQGKKAVMLKAFFPFYIQNDLITKHYYQIFLKKYEKYIFEVLLVGALKLVPRSANFRACIDNEQFYSFYQDDQQLELLKNFIEKLATIDNLQEFIKQICQGQEKTWPTLARFIELLVADKSYHKIISAKHTENCVIQAKVKKYIFQLEAHYIQHFLNSLSDYSNKAKPKTDIYKDFEEFIFAVRQKNINKYEEYQQYQKFLFIRQLKRNYIYDIISLEQPVSSIKLKGDILCSENASLANKKEAWLNSQETLSAAACFSVYETAIMEAEDNIAKAKHLLILAEAYLIKPLFLKKQFYKLLEQLSLAITIFKQALADDKTTTIAELLKQAYAKRALIYKKLAAKHDLYDIDNWKNLEQAKTDYYKAEQSQVAEDNFVATYLAGTKASKLTDAIKSYNAALVANPYFFEAHYQRLLAFYELKDLTRAHYLQAAFSSLETADNPILAFLKLICRKRAKQQAVINQFLNKTIKIKIYKHSDRDLYIKIKLVNEQYVLSCNSEFNLILLLKAGKASIRIIKKTKPLLNNYNNYDFRNIIDNIMAQKQEQEVNLKKYIDFFATTRLIDEANLLKQDMRLLALLPVSREILINIYAQNKVYTQANIQLSKAIMNYQELLLLAESEKQTYQNKLELRPADIRHRLLNLQLKRAANYQKQGYFGCEENELLDIIKNYLARDNTYPAVYYRLAMLSKAKGDIAKFYQYLTFAKKRDFDKTNKKIFKKTYRQEAIYTHLQSQAYLKHNSLAWLKLKAILTKQLTAKDFQHEDSFTRLTSCGIKLYPAEPKSYVSLRECLYSGLFINSDINISNDELSIVNVSDEAVIEKFNEHFIGRLILIPFEQVYKAMDNIVIPIIFFKKDNRYKIAVGLNKSAYINHLIVTNKSEINQNIQTACYQVLQTILNKSFRQEQQFSINDFKQSFELIMNTTTIKEFYEKLISLLDESNIDDFWVDLADLTTDSNLKEILSNFKKDFINAIDAFQQREEDKKAALLEQKYAFEKKAEQLQDFLAFKHLLMNKLSNKAYVAPKSKPYKDLVDVLSISEPVLAQLKKIMDILEFSTEKDKQFIAGANLNQIEVLVNLVKLALVEPEIIVKIAQLEIEGYNVFLSDILAKLEEKLLDNAHITKVFIKADNIFLDTSLTANCWHSKDFIVAGEVLEFVEDIEIDVSGMKGEDGRAARAQPNAYNDDGDGIDGEFGENGAAGQNGGDVFFIAKQEIRNRKLIKINVSGGDGGRGGRGGKGGDGRAGKDGKDAERTEEISWIKVGYRIRRGGKGTKGGQGGLGGKGGLGGFGGAAGQVFIKENKIDISDRFLIIKDDKSQLAAADGEPGEGGKGGLGGLDAEDELRVRYDWDSCFERGRELSVTEWCMVGSFLGLGGIAVPLKWSFGNASRDDLKGNDGKKGSTAEAQLRMGIMRNKSAMKQRIAESQLKDSLTSKYGLDAEIVHSTEQAMNQTVGEIESIEAKLQSQQRAIAIVKSAAEVATAYKLNVSTNKTSQWQILQEHNGTDTNNYQTNLSATWLKYTLSLAKNYNSKIEQKFINLKQASAKYKDDLLCQINTEIEVIKNNLQKTKKNFEALFFTHYSPNQKFFKNSILLAERAKYWAKIDTLKNKKSILLANKKSITNLNFNELIDKIRQECPEFEQVKLNLQKLQSDLKQFKENNLAAVVHKFEQKPVELTIDVADAELDILLNQSINF